MLQVSQIRSAIVKGLKSFTTAPTIVAEQGGNQPSYPFTTLKFTTLGDKIGHATQYMRGTSTVYEQDIEMVMSVSCYSDKIGAAEELAYNALQYFELEGIDSLTEQNITVVETTALTDRTTFLTVNWEYFIGFDVTLRVRAQVVKEAEFIDNVELNAEYEGGL